MMLEIDCEEHDERAAEEESRDEEQAGAVVPPREPEHRGRDRFDNRILDADRVLAGPAVTAQEQPAHNRNVLVPLDLAAAIRTRRGRPDNRGAEREPVDADVQETADDGAK